MERDVRRCGRRQPLKEKTPPPTSDDSLLFLTPGRGPEALRSLALPVGGETAARRVNARKAKHAITHKKNIRRFHEVVSKREGMTWGIATGPGEAMAPFTGHVRPTPTRDGARPTQPRRGP